MAELSKKSSQVEAAIKGLTGFDRVGAITSNTCVFCHEPAVEFKDQISKKEYTVSGICQKCQDETFG